MILPTVVVMVTIVAYPFGWLFGLSLFEYELPQLIGTQPAEFVGLSHFRELFTDPFFWVVLARTIGFMVANVVSIMLLGLLFALLMRRVARGVRLALLASLILAWAIPWIVAVTIWEWMVDFKFGVLNYLLSYLPFVDLIHHNWFVNAWQGFFVIGIVVVWQAIPFVAITAHAGLTQVPRELEEAARVDGAGAWQTFRNVTLPVLRPVLTIVAIFEIIWCFQVFNQIFVMLDYNPRPAYQVFSTYAFQLAFGSSQYGMAGAVAVVMVVCLLVLTSFYIRRMMRIGEMS